MIAGVALLCIIKWMGSQFVMAVGILFCHWLFLFYFTTWCTSGQCYSTSHAQLFGGNFMLYVFTMLTSFDYFNFYCAFYTVVNGCTWSHLINIIHLCTLLHRIFYNSIVRIFTTLVICITLKALQWYITALHLHFSYFCRGIGVLMKGLPVGQVCEC